MPLQSSATQRKSIATWPAEVQPSAACRWYPRCACSAGLWQHPHAYSNDSAEAPTALPGDRAATWFVQCWTPPQFDHWSLPVCPLSSSPGSRHPTFTTQKQHVFPNIFAICSLHLAAPVLACCQGPADPHAAQGAAAGSRSGPRTGAGSPHWDGLPPRRSEPAEGRREHQPGRCCQFHNADPQMFIMSTGTECSNVACTKQAGHTDGSFKTQQQAAVRTRTQ